MTLALDRAITAAESAVEMSAGLAHARGELADRVTAALSMITPSDVHARPDRACYLAGLLSYCGLTDGADQLLDQAADGDPQRSLHIENLRGVLAASRGEAGRAVDILRQVLASAGTDSPVRRKARANLAAAYLQTGDYAAANLQASELLSEERADPADPAAEVLAACVRLAALVRTDRDGAADLSELTDATQRLVAGGGSDPPSWRALAELSAIEFQVAVKDQRWDVGERCVEVLEVTAQRLGAAFGADHPDAMAVRGLLASAELDWAISDGSRQRAARAADLLAYLARRTSIVLGPRHRLSLSALIAHARGQFLLAEARYGARQRRAAWRAARAAVDRAGAALGPDHPLTREAARLVAKGRSRRFRWRSSVSLGPRGRAVGRHLTVGLAGVSVITAVLVAELTNPLLGVLTGAVAAVAVLLLDHRRRKAHISHATADIDGGREAATDSEAPTQPDIVGRHRELAALLRSHRRARTTQESSPTPGPVLLLLHGKPGVGKSVLAAQLAHRLAPEYPDARLYANLGGAEGPRPPTEVLRDFLLALGLPQPQLPQEAAEQARLFRTLSTGRQVLVILDDARHPEHVTTLLPTSSDCLVIVTSRRDLGPALGAPSYRVDEPDPDTALAILRAASHTDETTEPVSAQEIVEFCGYLPLAIRSAASRVTREGADLRHVADLLRPEHSRLRWLADDELDAEVRVAADYDLLRPLEQRALKMLALVDSPTFLPWVLGATLGVSQAEAESLITSLAAAQLVDRAALDPLTGAYRYGFNPLIRLFALSRLHDESHLALEQARWKLGTAYVATVAQVLGSPAATARGVSRWVGTEYLNLLRVASTAHEQERWELCWQVATLLGDVVPEGTDPNDCLAAFDMAEQAATAVDETAGFIDVLIAKGSFLAAIERYTDAEEVLRKAARLAQELRAGSASASGMRYQRQEARAHRKLGEAYLQIGAQHLARRSLETALNLARECGDHAERRTVELMVAESNQVLPPEHGLGGYAAGGGIDAPAFFRLELGLSENARRRADWRAAHNHLTRALDGAGGDARRAATVRYRLALLALHRWQHVMHEFGAEAATDPDPAQDLIDSAVRRAADALVAFQQMHNTAGMVRARCLLARCMSAAGEHTEAEQLCRIAERQLSSLDFASAVQLPLIARLRHAMGELMLRRGEATAGRGLLFDAATDYFICGDWTLNNEVLRFIENALRNTPDR